MKSGSVRLALCAVFALTSPLIVFAGGQPARVFMPSKADMQNVTGAARAIQQGKGSGMTRSQAANLPVPRVRKRLRKPRGVRAIPPLPSKPARSGEVSVGTEQLAQRIVGVAPGPVTDHNLSAALSQ